MGRTTILAGLVLSISAAVGDAAEPRPWVKLPYCIYLQDQNNDGDSFRVKCSGREFVLRLYYVDAPETNLSYPERTLEQSRHFGITLDQTMQAGALASEVVRKALAKTSFTAWTRWADAGGRGRVNRHYALIAVGGKDLGEMLIAQGLARNKGVRPNLPSGERAKFYKEKLYALEDLAQQRRLGAWAGSVPPQ